MKKVSYCGILSVFFFILFFFSFFIYMLKLERACVQGGGDLFFIFCVFARIYHRVMIRDFVSHTAAGGASTDAGKDKG